MKKIILSLLTLFLICSPLSALDLSYHSFANTISDYWMSLKGNSNKIMPYVFLGGIAAFLGYSVYKNYHKKPAVVKYLDDEEYLRSSEISIGGYPCRGQEQVIKYSLILKNERIPEITLKQCAVYNQHQNEGGGHASCGYHTVKNLLAIRHILQLNNQSSRNALRNLIDSPKYVQSYFGKNGTWRNTINNNRIESGISPEEIIEEDNDQLRKEISNGEWLDGSEIKSLLEGQVSEDEYTIINDITTLSAMGAPINKTLLEKPSIHLIAVRTGSTSSTHWFGIALHVKEDKTREYIVVDSKNSIHIYGGKVYESECLKKVIESIEGISVGKKLQAPCDIRTQLGQALTNMSGTEDAFPVFLNRYREWGGSQQAITVFEKKSQYNTLDNDFAT